MVPDLRTSAPRRWTESLGQIRWLPRLIDKTRAALAGQLGDYLFGQSPVDRELLQSLQMGHREFARIVRDAPGDADVLAVLQARSPESVRAARAWSDALPRRHFLMLTAIDVDDGYATNALNVLRTPMRFVAALATKTIKKVWPSHAVDGL